MGVIADLDHVYDRADLCPCGSVSDVVIMAPFAEVHDTERNGVMDDSGRSMAAEYSS